MLENNWLKVEETVKDDAQEAGDSEINRNQKLVSKLFLACACVHACRDGRYLAFYFWKWPVINSATLLRTPKIPTKYTEI